MKCHCAPQKLSLLHLVSAKKVLKPSVNSDNSADDSFEVIPLKVT